MPLVAKYCQGNFSPGSFFLLNAISECPKIFVLLILYFLIIYFDNLIKDKIWSFEYLWYPNWWPLFVISIPIEFLFRFFWFFQKEIYIKNLNKIGYNLGLKKIPKTEKKKFLKIISKAFQRRFRQDIIDGIIDKECLLISQNLVKKLD